MPLRYFRVFLVLLSSTILGTLYFSIDNNSQNETRSSTVKPISNTPHVIVCYKKYHFRFKITPFLTANRWNYRLLLKRSFKISRLLKRSEPWHLYSRPSGNTKYPFSPRTRRVHPKWHDFWSESKVLWRSHPRTWCSRGQFSRSECLWEDNFFSTSMWIK